MSAVIECLPRTISLMVHERMLKTVPASPTRMNFAQQRAFPTNLSLYYVVREAPPLRAMYPPSKTRSAMYPPTPHRAADSCPARYRAVVRLAFVAFLMPLLSACDPADTVDTTSDSDSQGLAAGAAAPYVSSATIQVPDSPEALTDVVEPDPQPTGRLRSPRHDMEPAGLWLQRLARAPNWSLAMHDAANAAQAIALLPEGAQRVFYPRLARTLEGVSHLSDLVVPTPKPTRQDVDDFVGVDYTAIHTICFVGFDLYSVLDAIPDQAETTFTYSPFWRQDCGDAGQVRVEPITPFYEHFHLNFEDPTIDCVDPDNGWKSGRTVGDECEVVSDFAAEPRYLGPHLGNEIMRIRAHDQSTGDPIPFDVISFANVGDEPVRFRYRNEGGQWFEWPSLGGPTNWGVNAYDAVEVLITNAGTSLDCGLNQEAGAPGGCASDLTQYYVDEFVIGLN